MAALRTTQVTSYRRFVVDSMIHAFRAVFNDTYNRDRQLADLKITSKYPLVKQDYPALVLEFQDSSIKNAGVGHEEWFYDEQNILRKWHHSRFEGVLSMDMITLSPVDRDLLADATLEVLRFGRLDEQLLPFFTTIYGEPDQPPAFIYSQLMLNVDEITGRGNTAAPAPWQPEDVLVYSTGYTTQLHGGLYNTYPAETWQFITSVKAEPYPQGNVDVVLPFSDGDGAWTNPHEQHDDAVVTGAANIVNPLTFDDAAAVSAQAAPTGVDVGP